MRWLRYFDHKDLVGRHDLKMVTHRIAQGGIKAFRSGELGCAFPVVCIRAGSANRQCEQEPSAIFPDSFADIAGLPARAANAIQ